MQIQTRLSEKACSSLTKVESIIAVFHELDQSFPLQYAQCFLLIAQSPGISVSELAQRAALKLPTTSRIVGALAQYRQKGVGFELIEIKESPEERRKKQLFLSIKGENIIQRLSDII